MKGISISPIYAQAIACGDKSIEARTWSSKYRGELLICSTADPGYADLRPVSITGHALAVADMVDCRPFVDGEDQARAFFNEPFSGYAFVLENIRPIVPVAIKGSQRLWNVPDDMEFEFLDLTDWALYSWWDEHGYLSLDAVLDFYGIEL